MTRGRFPSVIKNAADHFTNDQNLLRSVSPSYQMKLEELEATRLKRLRQKKRSILIRLKQK